MTSTPTQTSGRNRIAVGFAGLVALAALAFAGTPAVATPLTAITERVSYADLNLTGAAGRSVLDARLQAAARRVCDATVAAVSAPSWRAAFDSRLCYRAAVTEARGKAGEAVRLALLIRDNGSGSV